LAVHGAISDKEGKILLENGSKYDSILLSHIGYNSSVIHLEDVMDSVFLRPGFILPEVLVNYEKEKESYCGRSKTFWGTGINATAGYEVVCFIENHFQNKKTVASFVFWVNRFISSDSTFFRIVVYDVQNGAPGSCLFRSSSYFTGDHREKRIELSLRNQGLSFPPSGLYVGLEWLGCARNINKSSSYVKVPPCNLSIVADRVNRESNLNTTFCRWKNRGGDWRLDNCFVEDDKLRVPRFGLMVF
jgi:hypothetical protein